MGAYENLLRIREKCKKCGGSGFHATTTEEGVHLEDCKCVQFINEKMKFVRANIPQQYWEFGIENINAGFKKQNSEQLDSVHKFIDNLDMNITHGRSLWFSSTPGLGKSTIISSILKKAIDKKYLAYFLRASHAVSLKFEALRDKEALETLEYIVHETSILAIEEMEKVYLSHGEAMNNQLFFEFLSDVYDSKKALLISSNLPKFDVLGQLPTFVSDRFRTIPEVYFKGKSERRNKK